MRNRDINKEQSVKQKAIETIVKYGLEGFTINKLAKACGISVATPYVYYKDKDDLILKIVLEEGARMETAMLLDFDPESSLEEGLKVQWRNRFNYMIENPLIGQFFDQIDNSAYQEQFLKMFNGEEGNLMGAFKRDISAFIKNAMDRGEMGQMEFEVYWSVAYSPLYSLLRFHQRGQSMGGKPFKITQEILWSAFDRVIKALKN